MAGSKSSRSQAAEIGSVPEDWIVASLARFVSRVTYGFTNPMPTTASGPFMITAKDIHDGRIDYSTARHTSWEAYRDKLTDKSRPLVNDILLTKDGSIGRVAICDRDDVCINQSVALIQPNGQLHSRFLKYLLETPHYQRRMESDADGTTIKHIYITRVDKMEVAVPKLREQRAIAHVLGTLDDKIELNRRMNETLEAMARALFKSWFVDFDPVRAKAEGRDPGLPKHVADLFPDRFVDSELGEIPLGWEVGTLGGVLKQRVERCWASHETAARPYVPINCISSKSLFLADTRPGLEAKSSLTLFYKGDLLFGAMRPYFHKVCVAPFDGTTRTTAFVLVPKAPRHFGFGTLLLHHTDTIDYATRHSTGSTIPYAVWESSLEDMPTVIPLPRVLEAFDAAVRPMLERIPAAYFENRTLAALRDTLLPKLISGELRAKRANRFIEGVSA